MHDRKRCCENRKTVRNGMVMRNLFAICKMKEIRVSFHFHKHRTCGKITWNFECICLETEGFLLYI